MGIKVSISSSESSNSSMKQTMRNMRSTFVNPSLTPTEKCSNPRDPSQNGNLVTIASAELLYPNCPNSRKNKHSWLLFGKSDRVNQHPTDRRKLTWFYLPKHLTTLIQMSQNKRFIKEQPKDTHSLTCKSSRRSEVEARIRTTKS